MKILTLAIILLIPSICFSQVIINEIQSSNTSTLADEFGELDDWIELYNPDDAQIDIGGLVLKDNVDTWQIPANTILLSHEYFLLWADDEENQGEYHTNFKLSASNGEFLGLFESDSLTEIESVNIPPLLENQSYGKCPNGDWTIISDPTPLAINDCQLSSNQEFQKDLSIYPTLTNGHVNIELQASTTEAVNIYLYSINGELILEKRYDNNTITIDLRKLIPDLYILKVHTEKGTLLKKIVKVN